MTYWQNSGLIRIKGNPNNKRGYNNNGEKTFQCAGCFYNILWYGANEANGKLYCGGCNAELAEPGSRVEWEKPSQEQTTFTDNYESEKDKNEKKKKKEQPNFKPVEEENENYLLDIDPDIFGDTDLTKLTDEEKEQEAQKYFNNKAFKIWLKKYKFVASMPYHLFRNDLNAMRNYWKEWNKWKGETNNSDDDSEREQINEETTARTRDDEPLRNKEGLKVDRFGNTIEEPEPTKPLSRKQKPKKIN